MTPQLKKTFSKGPEGTRPCAAWTTYKEDRLMLAQRSWIFPSAIFPKLDNPDGWCWSPRQQELPPELQNLCQQVFRTRKEALQALEAVLVLLDI